MLSTVLSVFVKFLAWCLSMIITLSGVPDLWAEQTKTLSTLEKVTDNFYTMDYTYQYDLDDILENGLSTNLQIYTHEVGKLLFDFGNFGCTTFNSVSSNGDYIFSRNFDYMDSPYLLVWTHPKNGYASISSVSLYFFAYGENYMPEQGNKFPALLAPFFPLDGINEKGLSIGILELETDPVFQMTEKPNLTTSTLIRAVLDRAATVDEAIALFAKYDMRDYLFGECTYHYQIADAKGNTAVIEYVNGEMKVLYPAKSKTNKVNYMAATNFYLTEGVDDPLALGHDRYDTVMKKLKSTKGVANEKTAMNMLKSVSLKDSDMNGYICSTLWSAVYNNTRKTLNLCVYNDYNTVYKFSVSKPQVNLNK
ncbi:MAG: linear amide C-N hydrolase [Clostridia bacterium]|nr:linear amide C-N hydrolase [Clostridia bacterium]